ncbi:MAG: hypothetical protein ABFS42_12255 [Candidatus Krumholzibacteriota bacterium]
MAGTGLLAWNLLSGLIPEERPVRAKAEATELARSVLDYHADTGRWPRNSDGVIDLTVLLEGRAGGYKTNTTMAAGLSDAGSPLGHPATGGSWLKDIPLDPWGRPYLVMMTDTAIAVLSTGPNRKSDTFPGRLWARPGTINPCDGDDVGIVLDVDSNGEFK